MCRQKPISRVRTLVRALGKSSLTMLFTGQGSGMLKLWDSLLAERFICGFGMTHLWCDEGNSTHYAVGKIFPLMTRKHGLVILKKQSTSSFHTNNVTQTWSHAKAFYEQNTVESLRLSSHLQSNPGSHSPGKEMAYLPLGGEDGDPLLSSNTLLDQTPHLAQQGSHVSSEMHPFFTGDTFCNLKGFLRS